MDPLDVAHRLARRLAQDRAERVPRPLVHANSDAIRHANGIKLIMTDGTLVSSGLQPDGVAWCVFPPSARTDNGGQGATTYTPDVRPERSPTHGGGGNGGHS